MTSSQSQAARALDLATAVGPRALAVVDLETTGLDPRCHEIIQIGIVVLHPQRLKEVNAVELFVAPTRLETAETDALMVNGYDEDDWGSAIALREAMSQYAALTRGTTFLAFNGWFDLAFLHEAAARTGIRDETHYLKLDILSMAVHELGIEDPMQCSLDAILKRLGLKPEPKPHRALQGARLEAEVLRAIRRLRRERHE